MNLIDLAEVPYLLRTGLLSKSRFAPNSFLREDHFGEPRQPLADSVRDLVLQETGLAVSGPIRLLTQLRMLGYYFSPLNLFFCYGAAGCELQAIVAEVQNTPWLERHCYVLWQGNQVGVGLEAEYRHPKSFHVSPFMGMDMDYRWRIATPGERLRVGVKNTQENCPLFQAALSLKRVPLERRTQRAMYYRYLLMTAKITAAIYLQAFFLWRKKCPFHPHPKHRAELSQPNHQHTPSAQESSLVSTAAD